MDCVSVDQNDETTTYTLGSRLVVDGGVWVLVPPKGLVNKALLTANTDKKRKLVVVDRLMVGMFCDLDRKCVRG